MLRPNLANRLAHCAFIVLCSCFLVLFENRVSLGNVQTGHVRPNYSSSSQLEGHDSCIMNIVWAVTCYKMMWVWNIMNAFWPEKNCTSLTFLAGQFVGPTMPLLCFAVGSWRREKWHTVKMKVVVKFWLEMHINFHFTIWVYAQNWIQVKHIIETGSDQFKNLKFDHLVRVSQVSWR